MLRNIWRAAIKRMGPDSFLWCPATGQGAMGASWSIRSSVWTWRRTSSLWEWQNAGTGCPEGLWSLLLWRYSKPAWTSSCVTCSTWTCFDRGGLDKMIPKGPFQPLPFCDSVWLCEFRQKSIKAVYQVNQIKYVSNEVFWLEVLNAFFNSVFIGKTGLLKSHVL